LADKLTVKDLQQMKANGQKIVAAVVYEAQMAAIMERAGADVLSVGDSLGRAFLAHTEEGAFTIDEMVPFCRAVAKTAKRAVVNCDLPGNTLDGGPKGAAEAARRLVDVGAQTVKVDTRTDMQGLFACAEAVAKAGINVYPQIGHPDYRQRWTGPEAISTLVERAKALEAIGAVMIDLTGVASDVYGAVSQAVKIPVIGGQGTKEADGKIYVSYSLVGYASALLDQESGEPTAAAFILDKANKAFADVRSGNY
jgi:3-methyl-2-oxobutanoate hydroxymethyltransferase